MQQPSATVDEVLSVWATEELMERFPQFIWQRDLQSSGLTATSKLACKIGHCIPCWIQGGMTPVCQLTDTDVAHPLKAFARAAKDELMEQMKVKAHQEKLDKPSFH